MESLKYLDTDRLRRFAPLVMLSDEQLVLLASRLTVRQLDAGSTVMELGGRDNLVYFLLEGCVAVQAADGQQTQIQAGSDAARHAITPIQPRQFRVTATAASVLAIVELPLLTRLMKEAPMAGNDQPAKPAGGDMDHPAFALLMQFHRDLKANQVHLPSLPDVAFRIHQVAERDHTRAADIAKVIRQDPAMAVKLVRAANSSFYRGWSRIVTCEDAVVRLGIRTTRQLITIFALRELFKSRTSHFKDRMVRLWEHGREVGAIAYVLAKMTPGLNPEHAMLAGLIHEVGAIPVILYAEKHLSLVKYPEILEEVIQDLQAEVGMALLEHWGFSEDFISVVSHVGDFDYESGMDTPTYTDVVIIAKLHALIGKPGQAAGSETPSLDTLPALRKLALGELTADRSLKVLSEAQQELAEARLIAGG